MERKMNLKSFAFVFAFGVMAQAASPVKTVNCGMGYGPDASNLRILLDDEDNRKIILVGYEVIGNFFEMNLKGCSSIMNSNGQFVCDKEAVGTVGSVTIETEDPGYSGPRAPITLKDGRFEITGSCRPKDKQPLTLTILKKP